MLAMKIHRYQWEDLHGPVVVAVAGGGPASLTVKFVVGDSDTAT